MSDKLIPTYPISEFKKLKVTQLKRLKCAEITSDGLYLFTYINPTTAYIRTQAEYLGQLSNSNGKQSLEKIKEEVTV